MGSEATITSMPQDAVEAMCAYKFFDLCTDTTKRREDPVSRAAMPNGGRPCAITDLTEL